MAYDSTRPVPWKPLIRWAAVVSVLTTIAMLVLAREDFSASVLAGAVFGGVIYIAFGALLTKLGWTPPGVLSRSEREAIRAERIAARRGPAPAPIAPARPKPAPTSRTMGNQRSARNRKKR
ncbi:MAG: hypothetical protein AB7V43_19010 [Acidimicrobiia bacterium]